MHAPVQLFQCFQSPALVALTLRLSYEYSSRNAPVACAAVLVPIFLLPFICTLMDIREVLLAQRGHWDRLTVTIMSILGWLHLRVPIIGILELLDCVSESHVILLLRAKRIEIVCMAFPLGIMHAYMTLCHVSGCSHPALLSGLFNGSNSSSSSTIDSDTVNVMNALVQTVGTFLGFNHADISKELTAAVTLCVVILTVSGTEQDSYRFYEDTLRPHMRTLEYMSTALFRASESTARILNFGLVLYMYGSGVSVWPLVARVSLSLYPFLYPSLYPSLPPSLTHSVSHSVSHSLPLYPSLSISLSWSM
jgi:hypothetical protein